MLALSQHCRSELEPAYIEDVERDYVTASDFPEYVFNRNPHIVKINGGGRCSFDAHLLFFRAAAHPWEATLHQKRCELLATHFGEDRVEIGRAAIGNPHFLAVEDVVLSIFTEVGASARRQSVGTCKRLGERVRGKHLHFRELGQIFPFLVLIAEEDEWQRADASVC